MIMPLSLHSVGSLKVWRLHPQDRPRPRGGNTDWPLSSAHDTVGAVDEASAPWRSHAVAGTRERSPRPIATVFRRVH
jgi:hypothetical protein